MLQNLLILDGERLSYRTLDVEQIGSVYETMMGFSLEVARGRSIAIKPAKPHGAPTTINLEELLAVKPADRAKWLKEKTDQAVTGQAAAALKDARTPEDVVAALERKVAREATPNIVPPGAMVLQPSDERRRSGSHYTPRSLTAPIVAATLRPILDRLGPDATPEQILDLKVCDPAMGSGAFLVEACRALGEALVKAWHAHDCVPSIPPDEDEILHARRIVAQRCLYGVDKNPMAVDLAKLSLWLATLAKDHPFTFLDHALRCGDSLVGLSTKQIEAFHWKPERQRDFARALIADRVARATAYRREIREAAEATPETLLSQKLALADEALNPLRSYGDLVIAAFFEGSNDRQRKARLDELADHLSAYLHNAHKLELRQPLDDARRALRDGEPPVHPFHWEIEFPEVFDRPNPGFDAFVGNPPFAGKNTLIGGHRAGYLDWLKTIHEESHGNADLVAHFFRRAFNLLRSEGTFGLIATNTIGQGDTRSTGLRWICQHGGTIYEATRRKKWPGLAAVVISVVHVHKGSLPGPFLLDGRSVPVITAYLFHAGGHDDPAKLKANEGKSFVGSYVLGMGFTFDDTAKDGVANP
ncbi:MAG: N-6 DNA methylase, partial [Isosphaeraceae bacterium]|nr:N-6 DNA methylase [Isosphaeraceae bacterium]